ncbi:MAG: hypothetical protein NTU54_05090 [Candidatus Omnitrophica bacterium]|nr:hypothetical protein [Candidatus Omnitrophota bacterium]
MIFRISVAAELGRPALAETASNSFAIPELSSACGGLHRDSLNAQAPLAKISIRSKIRQVHLIPKLRFSFARDIVNAQLPRNIYLNNIF